MSCIEIGLCELQEDSLMSEVRYIKSPLNYTGGKAKLLKQLEPLFGSNITTFVDLFCGSGTVGVNIEADRYYYNDLSGEVIGLIKLFSEFSYGEIVSEIESLIKSYGLSDTYTYGYAHYHVESSKGAGDYNKANYMRLRSDFNKVRVRDKHYYIMLFMLICYSFNNQIRFNNRGEFNMPVGKRDFNANMRKNLSDFMSGIQRQDRVISCGSFERFDVSVLDTKSLVYCDPPYLISTATYNEQNGWTLDNEKRLLDFLDKLNSLGFRFALSNILRHKGKENELLKNWASCRHYIIHDLNFNYNNSSYHGKNTGEETQEVLITNY